MIQRHVRLTDGIVTFGFVQLEAVTAYAGKRQIVGDSLPASGKRLNVFCYKRIDAVF
jgi:hypothetical protein